VQKVKSPTSLTLIFFPLSPLPLPPLRHTKVCRNGGKGKGFPMHRRFASILIYLKEPMLLAGLCFYPSALHPKGLCPLGVAQKDRSRVRLIKSRKIRRKGHEKPYERQERYRITIKILTFFNKDSFYLLNF
jgi:hypothetical protein